MIPDGGPVVQPAGYTRTGERLDGEAGGSDERNFVTDGFGEECGALAILTLRGTPFLYYGEEIGMTDGEVPAERAYDPAGRDPCRTPMQWDDSPGAGFTIGTSWLPVPDAAGPVTVAAQRADPDSLLSLYRRLIRLRRELPALHCGDLRTLDGAGADVFAYERTAEGQRVVVALNFADTESDLGLPPHATVALSTDGGRALGRIDHGTLRLRPVEGVVALLD